MATAKRFLRLFFTMAILLGVASLLSGCPAALVVGGAVSTNEVLEAEYNSGLYTRNELLNEYGWGRQFIEPTRKSYESTLLGVTVKPLNWACSRKKKAQALCFPPHQVNRFLSSSEPLYDCSQLGHVRKGVTKDRNLYCRELKEEVSGLIK